MIDNHATRLGEIVGNLQALEMLLRMFLHKLPGAKPLDVPYGTDIYTLPVGHELPENELTNYDSLGMLVNKFNRAVAENGGKQLISNALVELRDALAHGRISANEAYEMSLLKFGKPRNGIVKILYNQIMTEEWFNNQKKTTSDALKIVGGQLGINMDDNKTSS